MPFAVGMVRGLYAEPPDTVCEPFLSIMQSAVRQMLQLTDRTMAVTPASFEVGLR